MKILSMVTVGTLLCAPMAFGADLLGIRLENRVQGGEHTALTQGNNNSANAASVRIDNSSVRSLSNRVQATGKVSAVGHRQQQHRQQRLRGYGKLARRQGFQRS